MLKIRLLKGGRVVETFDAKWTINIADIASEAGELEPQHGADYWEIVNDIGATVMRLTSSRPLILYGENSALVMNDCSMGGRVLEGSAI